MADTADRANRANGSKKGRTADLATLQVGYMIALTLKEGAAPSRCYVGEVQAVDERGVRMTLVDWLVGKADSWDFFVPWDSITSALVATPQHHLEAFGDAASRWQSRCDEIGKAAPVDEATDEDDGPRDWRPR